MSLAKTPDEVVSVQNLLESARQYQSAREEMEQEQQGAPAIQSSVSEMQSVQATSAVARSATPNEPHGPRRGMKGTIRNLHCSQPAILELTVEGDGKTLSLHSNNYFKIQFSALGFTPAGELHPCTDLEGMKARVEFFEAAGKSVEGQISFIELSK